MEEYKQMIAVWKPIPGYDQYEVSDQGGVRSSDRLVTMTIRGTECQSLRRGRTLKPAKDNCGYLNVRLSKDGKSRSFYVHRLVAAAFIPNPDNFPQVNHKDEDKTNNVAKNLEWCTAKRNSSYGTRPARLQTKVAKYTIDGELLQVYDSVKAAAVDTGCHYTSISHCCRGDLKTSHGFVWKYIEEDATTRISADGGGNSNHIVIVK